MEGCAEKGLFRYLAAQPIRYKDSRRGRPTVPGRVLATVMILQAHEGLSDQEAVDRLEERKRADEQIQMLNGELRRQVTALTEINAELEAFNYSISHDLRAPLRSMQGFARALLEDEQSQLGEAGREYARRIMNSSGYMDALLQDLLHLFEDRIYGLLCFDFRQARLVSNTIDNFDLPHVALPVTPC